MAVVSEVFTFKNKAKHEKIANESRSTHFGTRLTGELLGDFVGFAEGVYTGCFVEVGSPPIKEGEGYVCNTSYPSQFIV